MIHGQIEWTEETVEYVNSVDNSIQVDCGTSADHENGGQSN